MNLMSIIYVEITLTEDLIQTHPLLIEDIKLLKILCTIAPFYQNFEATLSAKNILQKMLFLHYSQVILDNSKHKTCTQCSLILE